MAEPDTAYYTYFLREHLEGVPALIEAQLLKLRAQVQQLADDAVQRAAEHSAERALHAAEHSTERALHAAEQAADRNRITALEAELATFKARPSPRPPAAAASAAQPPSAPVEHPTGGCSGDGGGSAGDNAMPEIKTTPTNGMALVVPSGSLTFSTAECRNATDHCELSRQLQAVLSKFDGGD